MVRRAFDSRLLAIGLVSSRRADILSFLSVMARLCPRHGCPGGTRLRDISFETFTKKIRAAVSGIHSCVVAF